MTDEKIGEILVYYVVYIIENCVKLMSKYYAIR